MKVKYPDQEAVQAFTPTLVFGLQKMTVLPDLVPGDAIVARALQFAQTAGIITVAAGAYLFEYALTAKDQVSPTWYGSHLDKLVWYRFFSGECGAASDGVPMDSTLVDADVLPIVPAVNGLYASIFHRLNIQPAASSVTLRLRYDIVTLTQAELANLIY